MELWVDIIGWIGAASLLTAYGLTSSGRADSGGLLFQNLNLVGAAGLTVNSAYFGAFPSVALNIIWIIIGLVTLRKILSAARAG